LLSIFEFFSDILIFLLCIKTDVLPKMEKIGMNTDDTGSGCGNGFDFYNGFKEFRYIEY